MVALEGLPHSFKNESDKSAKMLIMVAPAGLENMFLEVGVPLPEGSITALPPTQDEIEKLLEIAPKYGIEIRVPHPARCDITNLNQESNRWQFPMHNRAK